MNHCQNIPQSKSLLKKTFFLKLAKNTFPGGCYVANVLQYPSSLLGVVENTNAGNEFVESGKDELQTFFLPDLHLGRSRQVSKTFSCLKLAQKVEFLRQKWTQVYRYVDMTASQYKGKYLCGAS